MMENVFKRILRRPFLSLTGLILASGMCFILCFLVEYRSDQVTGLEEIRNSYEIVCTVTDARGIDTQRLRLHRRFIDFIEDEENGIGSYIKDLKVTRELFLDGAIPPEGEETPWGVLQPEKVTRVWYDWPDGNEHIEEYWVTPKALNIPYSIAMGMSDPSCCELTDPSVGGAYYSTVTDFFGSSEHICLVAEPDYESLAGRTITFQMGSPYTKEGGRTVRNVDLTIVGYYKGTGTMMLLPYAAAQDIGYTVADTISVDSISFVLKDNTTVDEVKKKAMEVFTEPQPFSFSGRAAIVIRDSVYRMTMREMEQNIKQIDRLIPISLVLSLLAGFLVGYLTVRGETRTYALMRTLGVGPLSLGVSVLLEQLLLPIVGCAVVGILMRQPMTALLYFGCHLLGCVLAVLRPVFAAPTKLLRVQE